VCLGAFDSGDPCIGCSCVLRLGEGDSLRLRRTHEGFTPNRTSSTFRKRANWRASRVALYVRGSGFWQLLEEPEESQLLECDDFDEEWQHASRHLIRSVWWEFSLSEVKAGDLWPPILLVNLEGAREFA